MHKALFAAGQSSTQCDSIALSPGNMPTFWSTIGAVVITIDLRAWVNATKPGERFARWNAVLHEVLNQIGLVSEHCRHIPRLLLMPVVPDEYATREHETADTLVKLDTSLKNLRIATQKRLPLGMKLHAIAPSLSMPDRSDSLTAENSGAQTTTRRFATPTELARHADELLRTKTPGGAGKFHRAQISAHAIFQPTPATFVS